MRAPSLPSVTLDVRASDGDRRANRAALARLTADVLGHAVPLTRRCPHCGGTDHGRPEVPGAWVSLARTRGLVALAVSISAPVGVDVERVSLVAVAGLDAFSDDECAAVRLAADADVLRTLLWTVKEAALKADGRGLRVDPRDVEVTPSAGSVRIGGAVHVAYTGAVRGTAVVHRLDDDVLVAIAVPIAPAIRDLPGQSGGTASR